MKNETPWIFVFAVGLLIGLIIGKWDTIKALWSHRQQLSGIGKVSEGLNEMGVT